MKSDWSHIEQYRQRGGLYGTEPGSLYGKFVMKLNAQAWLMIVASDGCEEVDGERWEHVSVSAFWKKLDMKNQRLPTWDEMCIVKDLFWDKNEATIQFHPPESDYVNHNKFCLHIWKPCGWELRTPPSIMVGPKS